MWLQAEAISRFGSPVQGSSPSEARNSSKMLLRSSCVKASGISLTFGGFLMDDCCCRCCCRLQWHSLFRLWGAWHLVRGVLNKWTGSGIMVRTGVSRDHGNWADHGVERERTFVQGHGASFNAGNRKRCCFTWWDLGHWPMARFFIRLICNALDTELDIVVADRLLVRLSGSFGKSRQIFLRQVLLQATFATSLSRIEWRLRPCFTGRFRCSVGTPADADVYSPCRFLTPPGRFL